MADTYQLKAVISANSAGIVKALGDVSKVAQNTRKYLADVAFSSGKLGTRLGLPVAAFSGVLGGFSLVAIKNAITSFGEMGDSIKKGSIRAGMTVEQYQKMKYVSEQAGVGVEMLEGAMGKLNLNMGKAAAGKSQDVSALFKRLGIDMRDANGHIKDGVDVLPQLADAFERNKDPAVQARMGMALFGKKWQEIAPMLMQGGAGIAETLERMNRFKGVMSDEDVEGARQFAKSMRDLDFVTKGFQMTIAKNLAPVIKPLIDDFASWAVANKQLISAKVSEMAKDLARWIKTIDFKSVISGVEDFIAGIGKFIDFVGGGKNALIALIVFMNAGAIMALVDLGGAVIRLAGFLGGPLMGAVRAVWAVMVANPIGVLIAAVVGLAVIVYQNWDNIVAYVSAAWDRIKLVFDAGFFDGIIQVWLEAWQGLANGILGIIKTILPDKLMPDALKNFNFSFATDRATRIGGAGSADVSTAGPYPLPGDNRGGPRASSFPMLGDNSGGRPSLITPQSSGRVEGQVNININGLPQGSRVEQVSGAGTMPLNLNAGYRWDAVGMP